MVKHRWAWSESGNGSAKCLYCKAKTAIKSRKKLRGAGKTTERQYSKTAGGWTKTLPKCVSKGAK